MAILDRNLPLRERNRRIIEAKNKTRLVRKKVYKTVYWWARNYLRVTTAEAKETALAATKPIEYWN